MSDANRTRLSYAVEATWGTHPGGSIRDVRYTGESLKQTTNTAQSQEIRSDRNIADLLRVNISGDGDLNIELSYPESPGFLNDLLRGALMSADWTTPTTPTLGTECVVSAASGMVATLTRQAGSWIIDLGLSGAITTFSGRFVKLAGYTGSGITNNQVVKILTVASATVCTAMFTDVAPVNTSGGDDAGVTQTIGAYIRNGTNVPTAAVSGSFSNSFYFEKNFADLTTEFEKLPGLVVDRFSFAVGADKISTGSFSFLGRRAISDTSSGGSGYNAAGTAPVYSGVDNVQSVLVGGALIQLTDFTGQIQNNLRARQEIGTLGATSVGAGSVNATGTTKAYYSSATELAKYQAGTSSTATIVFEDTNNNKWVIDFPRIKYTSGQRLATGINTDIYLELAFQALYGSATENYTVSFTRF